MVRLKARIDANQPEIVKALRSLGASVQHLHTVGKGCPDICVGIITKNCNRINVLVEIKDGSKPESQQKLTPDEVEFQDEWRGMYAIVNSVESAADLYEYIYEEEWL